jgi:hypothetical protein
MSSNTDVNKIILPSKDKSEEILDTVNTVNTIKKKNTSTNAVDRRQGTSTEAVDRRQGTSTEAVDRRQGTSTEAVDRRQGTSTEAVDRRQGIIDYTKTNFTEEEKYIIRNEVEIIKQKYPNYIPIIVRLHNNDKTIKLTKSKFLVTNEITLAQFLSILRKKITNVKSTESLFLLINNTLMPITLNLSSIYKEKKDKDTNMLFITVCKENTFG